MIHLSCQPLTIVLAGLAGVFLALNSVQADVSLAVADGLQVSLEYTLTLPDKSVAESNVGKEPFSYVHGSHMIVPGLESALVGLRAGDRKRVVVSPEQGYGAYDEKRRVTVPRSKAPVGVKVGSVLTNKSGLPFKVIEMTSDSVVMDTNHPLAGKELTFDVKVLQVERPPKNAETNR